MEGAIEEIEEELLNLNTTTPPDTFSSFQYVMLTSIFILELLEASSNLAFVYVYYRNKRLRSRTYTILCNWFIWNFLSLIVFFNGLVPFVGHLLPEFGKHHVHGCLSAYTHTPLKMATSAFALALHSDAFVEYSQANMPKILIYVYVGIIFVGGTELLQCFTYQFFAKAPEYLLLFLYLANILTTLEKEVKRCRKTGSWSVDAGVRLNVARLYSYNLLFWFCLLITLVQFGEKVRINEVHILAFFDFLSTLYIFVYIYRVDGEFRESLKRVLRFGANRENFNELLTQGGS